MEFTIEECDIETFKTALRDYIRYLESLGNNATEKGKSINEIRDLLTRLD